MKTQQIYIPIYQKKKSKIINRISRKLIFMKITMLFGKSFNYKIIYLQDIYIYNYKIIYLQVSLYLSRCRRESSQIMIFINLFIYVLTQEKNYKPLKIKIRQIRDSGQFCHFVLLFSPYKFVPTRCGR